MIPGQVYYQLRLLWYETRAILRHKSTPGQLVFGRDTIINSPFIADWGDIRMCKQRIIYRRNQIENKIINHKYIEYGIKY